MYEVIRKSCPTLAFYSNFLIAFLSFILPVEDCISGSGKLVGFNHFSQRSFLDFNYVSSWLRPFNTLCIVEAKGMEQRSTVCEPALYTVIRTDGIAARRITDGQEVYRDASQFKIANALIQDNTSEERDSLRAGSLVGRVSLAKELARGMGRGKVSLHASY